MNKRLLVEIMFFRSQEKLILSLSAAIHIERYLFKLIRLLKNFNFLL